MKSVLWLMACVAGLSASAFGAPPPGPGGEGPGPGPEGRFEGNAPTEAQQREVLEFIQQHNPEMAAHLNGMREREPDAFRRRIREIYRMYSQPEVRETWVRQQEAEQKVRSLADNYRKADAKQKEAVRPELEAALLDEFDAKVAEHELRVKKMQEEIGRLKDQIAKRKALKSQVVKKRFAEVVGEDVESWNW